MLINLEKKGRVFGVLRTLGWLLKWNTALIHCALDQELMWVVLPSELAFHRVQDHRKRSSDEGDIAVLPSEGLQPDAVACTSGPGIRSVIFGRRSDRWRWSSSRLQPDASGQFSGHPVTSREVFRACFCDRTRPVEEDLTPGRPVSVKNA